MHSQQSQTKRPGENAGVAFQVAYTLANAHATCLTVFVRSRFGTRALGLNGLLAMVLIPLYGALATAPEMFPFGVAWLAVLACRRAGSLRLARRGVREHSAYDGWPWLALLCPFVRREGTAKVLVEPALCLLAGSLLMPLSQPLGGFVLVGTFTLLFKAGTDREVNRSRLRAMRDAHIESTQLAEQFRGLGDEF